MIEGFSHASLFSGIGGFDLAAEIAGFTNVFAVEKDKFCQKVLRKNFPEIDIYSDIKEFEGKNYYGSIDVISGGFPCQPFSIAGNQRSKEDDRFLWPEMFRVIKNIKPEFILLENVPPVVKLALDEVLSDLETEGYTHEAFIIPAYALNASHRRDRVWVIAYPNSSRQKKRCQCLPYRSDLQKEKPLGQENKKGGRIQFRFVNSCSVAPDSHGFGCYNRSDNREERQCWTGSDCKNITNSLRKRLQIKKPPELRRQKGYFTRSLSPDWSEWDVKPTICRENDGIPRGLDANRIKALGNAIVPQIAYQFFTAIKEKKQNILKK